MRRIGIALVATAILSFGALAQDNTYRLTLAGASPGGLWSLLGVGVDRVMKAEYPNSTVTYQTSGGGVANVGLVEQQKAELGLVHNAEMGLALEGLEPFREKSQDLVAIANLYDWAPMQLIVAKSFADKHGLKTFEDIATKKPPLRISTNRRGNISQMVADRMFAAIGVDAADIEEWGGAVVLSASEEQAELLRNGRIDAILNSLFVGQGSLVEIGTAMDVVMLPAGDETIAKVAADMGVTKFVIPANSYDFQPEEIPTVSLGAFLVAHKSLPDDVAHAVAKALVENIDEMKAVHPAMKALTPEFLTQQELMPYHPGAAAFYKESGLLE